MAYYTKTFTTECFSDLFDAVANNEAIAPGLIQLINAEGPDIIFEFDGSLSTAEEAELDSVLSSWTCPPPPEEETGSVVINDGVVATDNIWSSSKVAAYVDAEVSNVATGIVSLVGKTFGVGFASSSNKTSKLWLRQQTSDSGMASNRLPFVIPWDCRLIAMTYINGSDGITTDVELWKAEFDYEPKANKTLVHTHSVTNSRSAVELDFGSSDVLFSAGDTVAIYVDGDKSDHPVVQLTFMITSGTTTNMSESFKDDFA